MPSVKNANQNPPRLWESGNPSDPNKYQWTVRSTLSTLSVQSIRPLCPSHQQQGRGCSLGLSYLTASQDQHSRHHDLKRPPVRSSLGSLFLRSQESRFVTNQSPFPVVWSDSSRAYLLVIRSYSARTIGICAFDFLLERKKVVRSGPRRQLQHCNTRLPGCVCASLPSDVPAYNICCFYTLRPPNPHTRVGQIRYSTPSLRTRS